MNRIYKNILLGLLRQQQKWTDPSLSSQYRIAKALHRYRVSIWQNIKSALLIIIGILSAGFGLNSFLLPNRFIDGGATGIALLIVEVTKSPLSYIIILVNIPFVYLGWRQLGGGFALKMVLAILGLALCIAFINYPIVTNDKLLVAVFGGFFLGMGIGFAIRGGAVLDGSEVLAIFVSKKTGSTIGDIIMLINVLIFSSAVYLLSVETALYSMLTYIAAAKTVDFIIEGIEEYTGVTIISTKSVEISKMITEKLGRGITLYRGAGGYGKQGYVTQDIDIIFSVVTRLEISKLRSEIELLDPNAFVVMNTIKDTKGGMIKKRPLKH
ncbi:MAG TPA: YitT family protein [Flavitalea sp.]|nr:YitT family protein [Flavitalea sp.]